MSEKNLVAAVQSQYAAVAKSGLSNDSDAVRSIAEAFGYSPDQLASLPAEANMGLSCGNPTAVAALRAGEVVVDLGSGGGMDVFLAAKLVGPTGKAIGIDMTPEMIERARTAAARIGADNVEFHLAEIDNLPLPDSSVDCVISNCVINLVLDKSKVFREILRILKPGGRVAISDIALKQPLPPEIAADMQAYVGCVSGAILLDDYRRQLAEAGFASVVVSDTGADLNAYAEVSSGSCCSSTASACCSPAEPAETTEAFHDGLSQVLGAFDANAYAASVRVHALKPAMNQQPPLTNREDSMATITVYDKPMCCSTGVCGPQVDPALAQFAADLDWLKSQGHHLDRFNLAQQPGAFAENDEVRQILAAEGTSCLPLVVVNGVVMSRGHYPSRKTLAEWTDAKTPELLPVMGQIGAWCGGSRCC